MSKFSITVTAGVAAVYPYGQCSDVTKVLYEGESIDCEVPVGEYADPRKVESLGEKMKADTIIPAAGVAKDEPLDKRTGTLEVEVTEGVVNVRTYAGAHYMEKPLKVGEKASAQVTETNAITIAVYDLSPTVNPRS